MYDKELLSEEFYIDDDGIKLHMKLDRPAGQGSLPLAVVVHGFTGHMEEPHITGISRALNGRGIATLRAELYGHGKSGGRFEDHTIYKWMSELMTVINYAASLEFATKLFLVGHSQGGLCTVLTGGLMADRLDAIVPLSPAMSIAEDASTGHILDAEFDPYNIPDKVIFPDGKVLGGNYFRAAQFLPVEEAIKRFRGPVLVVHGDGDESVPVSCGIELAKKYKNASLAIIKGDTHCYDNKLEEVEKAVADFLEALA
ncbi:MAG: alpha/beta fold hydrolase [Blautia sp.]|nr:alpha/beta fold hydrolase [Blautia sp.]